MKRLLCPKIPSPSTSTLLSETEAHHATRVLRLQEGDIVEAMDGKGHQVHAALRRRGKSILLEYVEPSQNILSTIPSLPLTLEMAVLKGEAMEWVVEKAVELGIQRLVPVITVHTVVQMKAKGPDAFRERWQKIADQALKQCGRPQRMEIVLPIALDQLLLDSKNSKSQVRLICNEATRTHTPFLMDWLQTQTSPPGSSWTVLIGPEGGWSSTEKELFSLETQSSSQFFVSLGPVILRAETAALFAISLTSGILRSKKSFV